MKEQILEIFKNTNDYISGQELCERFQVSRTAIWKVINQLKEEGYEIEAVRNRGYRLISCPDVLLSAEISSELKTRVWGQELHSHSTIDSTNTEVRRLAENGAKEGLLVIADEQTAGKGRRGRSWTSEPGENIYMSYLLRPDIDPSNASMITLVAALSCAQAICEVTGLPAQIKWPNDIVVNGHKVTGILTEMSTEMTSIQYVVVGIGINVNQKTFPEEIREVASSLSLELGQDVVRSRIIAAYGNFWEQNYDLFLKAGNLSGIRAIYERFLVNIDREVVVIDAGGNQEFISRGINDMGELLVEDADGTVQTVRAGEVSVRGIYGYV